MYCRVISKKSRFLVLAGILIFLISGNLYAQLSGTFTIGSGGTYASFTDAVSALNSQGVSGSVVFNVLTGVYDEQFEIGTINGVSGSNRVSFQAQTGNAADVTLQFSQTAGANYIIRMNGSDYITFQNLTFTASGTSYGRIIVLGDNSDNNTVSNCVFSGAAVNTTSDAFSAVYCAPTTNTSDAVTISDNVFNDVSVGVYFNGVNYLTLASGIQVTNNTFTHVRRGIVLNYHLAPVISGNVIQSDGDRGIEVQYGNSAMQITKNRIDLANTYGIYLLYCTGGTPPAGTPGLTANNFITVRAENGRGIYNLYGNYKNFYHNSVNMTAGVNSHAFEDNGSSGNINVVNNIFAAPAGGYAYYVNTPAAIANSNYNDHYTTGARLAYWNGDRADLAAFQSASQKEINSFATNPGYRSATDLHATSALIDSAGTPLAEVTDDIDGNPRDAAYPSIGANEIRFGVSGLDNDNKPDHDLTKIPVVYALYQNYPNPFNPETNIQFDLPKSSHVSLKIFNTLGEQVKVLVESNMPAGRHRIHWNAAGFSSGTYFYVIQADAYTNVKRMLYII